MSEELHLSAILDRVASRRRFIAGVGSAAFAATFLAACGGGEDEQATSTSTATASPTSTATESVTATAEATETAVAGFPVTITHAYGTTEIAAEPKRVLSLGYSDQDAILAVGVVPIATRYWFGDEPGAIFPWATEALGGAAAPEVLNMPWDALDFEKIASLQPDVIIGVYSGITEEEYTTLSAIAPVVAQSGDYINYGMPWDEAARLVGFALGRGEQMEAVISDVEARFAAAREANPDFAGKKLTLAAMREDGQVALFAEQDGRMRFFVELGFSMPEEAKSVFGETFYADISQEQLGLLDTADVVGWTQVVYAGGPDKILTHEVYSQLDVAKESRHFLLGDRADEAFSFNSVLSLPYALENVVPQLALAIDGDPTTNIEYEPKA